MDVTVMKNSIQLTTDWYVKLTVTHQYLYVSSCDVSNSKKINIFQKSLASLQNLL